MKQIQESWEDRFDIKFPQWIDFSKYVDIRPEIESFIKAELSLALKEQREEIVDMIGRKKKEIDITMVGYTKPLGERKAQKEILEKIISSIIKEK